MGDAQKRESIDTWYLDLRLLRKWYDPPHVYHHTPPTTLFYAVREALAIIAEEGLEHRWQRHYRANQRLISGLQKLGFQPFVSEPANRIWHLVTARVPDSVNEADLRIRLMRDFNIDVAAGIGKLAAIFFGSALWARLPQTIKSIFCFRLFLPRFEACDGCATSIDRASCGRVFARFRHLIRSLIYTYYAFSSSPLPGRCSCLRVAGNEPSASAHTVRPSRC